MTFKLESATSSLCKGFQKRTMIMLYAYCIALDLFVLLVPCFRRPKQQRSNAFKVYLKHIHNKLADLRDTRLL